MLDKASVIVWVFVGLAALAAFGLVLLTIAEIVTERRERRRLATAMDDPDLSIDTHLAQLERELSGLKEHFQSDYPGGPLVIGDPDGHQRQVRPPGR